MSFENIGVEILVIAAVNGFEKISMMALVAFENP